VIHRLEEELTIPRDRATVFEFFSSAANLELITPPELQFKILSKQPIAMQVGALIDYRLKLHGIPFRWQSRISRWEPPHAFADEQLTGPYRSWVHTHSFEEIEGGTLIRDSVDYALPLWPLSGLGMPIVRRQLSRIFEYRSRAIERALLGKTEDK
jgi:ligand-binding SRPBCC domain-containing protein